MQQYLRMKNFGDRAERLYRAEEAKKGTGFSHQLWRVLLRIFHPVNYSLVVSQSELNAPLQNRAWEPSNNQGILCIALLLGIILFSRVDAETCFPSAPYIMDYFHIHLLHLYSLGFKQVKVYLMTVVRIRQSGYLKIPNQLTRSNVNYGNDTEDFSWDKAPYLKTVFLWLVNQLILSSIFFTLQSLNYQGH